MCTCDNHLAIFERPARETIQPEVPGNIASDDACSILTPTADEPTDAELASRARAGDSNAVAALVDRHRGMVYELATRAPMSPRVELDDLIQAGLIALVRAAATWVPEHGTGSKLSTYAWRAVSNEVAKECRRHTRAVRTVDPRPDYYTLEDGGSESPRTRLDQIPDRVSDTLDPSSLLASIARLDPVRRLVVSLKFGLADEPMELPLVARRAGLSISQTQEVLAEALVLLRGDVVE